MRKPYSLVPLQIIVAGMFMLFILALCSCSFSKHLTRSSTTTDSTVYAENKMLRETNEAMGRKIDAFTLDSQAVIVEFDTVRVSDTFTKVVFKEGRLVTVQGPVRRIITRDTHTESVKDSLYTLVQIMSDSISTLKAEKHVESKVVTKLVKRGNWWWVVVALVIGWILRGYWPRLRFALFGK